MSDYKAPVFSAGTWNPNRIHAAVTDVGQQVETLLERLLDVESRLASLESTKGDTPKATARRGKQGGEP